jgi:hypothetical protein
VEIVTGRIRPPTAEEQELYNAIPLRHTYRWPFTGRAVRPNILTEITAAAAVEKGWLRVLFPFQVRRWLQAAAHAESEFAHDEQYLAELRRWTSGAEPGLGVPKAADGPQPLAVYPPVRDFSCAWRDGRPVERFERHPQLLSLATDYDRPLDWLRAGQALQRALLTATRYGVAASFLTQSLELADRQREPRGRPGARTFHEAPQMLLRVGYPVRAVPAAPRENAPDVVDLRSYPPRQVLPPDLPAAERELRTRWHLRG